MSKIEYSQLQTVLWDLMILWKHGTETHFSFIL